MVEFEDYIYCLPTTPQHAQQLVERGLAVPYGTCENLVLVSITAPVLVDSKGRYVVEGGGVVVEPPYPRYFDALEPYFIDF